MNEIKATPGNCRGAIGRRVKERWSRLWMKELGGVPLVRFFVSPGQGGFAAPQPKRPVGPHKASRLSSLYLQC